VDAYPRLFLTHSAVAPIAQRHLGRKPIPSTKDFGERKPEVLSKSEKKRDVLRGDQNSSFAWVRGTRQPRSPFRRGVMSAPLQKKREGGNGSPI